MSYFSVLEWFSVLVRNPISASRWRAQIKSLPASIPFVLLTARRVEQPPAAAQLQPWTRCWEGRKLTSGVPLYRCCQTHCWQPVQSQCSEKLYLHIHAYMCIHRRWLSLAPRRLQTCMVFLSLSCPFPCLPFHCEALKVFCNSDWPVQVLYLYKWKKEPAPLSYLQM